MVLFPSPLTNPKEAPPTGFVAGPGEGLGVRGVSRNELESVKLIANLESAFRLADVALYLAKP